MHSCSADRQFVCFCVQLNRIGGRKHIAVGQQKHSTGKLLLTSRWQRAPHLNSEIDSRASGVACGLI